MITPLSAILAFTLLSTNAIAGLALLEGLCILFRSNRGGGVVAFYRCRIRVALEEIICREVHVDRDI
jgi:hypothetical protein